MTVMRIFTFDDPPGLSSYRAPECDVRAEDNFLNRFRPSNAQLATLYFVDSLGDATIWEIGFALVMNRSSVARNLQYLRQLNVLESLQRNGSAVEAVRLRDAGSTLLQDAMAAWRTRKAAGHTQSNALPMASQTHLAVGMVADHLNRK